MQRCQAETTSREFMDWQAYFQMEVNQPRREDYYAAQIAAEIRRVLHKHPARVKIEDFIFKFRGAEKPKELTPEDVAARTAASKGKWLALLKPKRKEG